MNLLEGFQVLSRALTDHRVTPSEYMKLYFVLHSRMPWLWSERAHQASNRLFYVAEDFIEYPELRTSSDMDEAQFRTAIAEATAELTMTVGSHNDSTDVTAVARETRLVACHVELVVSLLTSGRLDRNDGLMLLRFFLESFTYPAALRSSLEDLEHHLSTDDIDLDAHALSSAKYQLAQAVDWLDPEGA